VLFKQQVLELTPLVCTVIPKENIVSTRIMGACVMRQRNHGRFNESLVVMLFELLILLDAGPWQVSLIRLI